VDVDQVLERSDAASFGVRMTGAAVLVALGDAAAAAAAAATTTRAGRRLSDVHKVHVDAPITPHALEGGARAPQFGKTSFLRRRQHERMALVVLAGPAKG
jgi:hypothetical protein